MSSRCISLGGFTTAMTAVLLMVSSPAFSQESRNRPRRAATTAPVSAPTSQPTTRSSQSHPRYTAPGAIVRGMSIGAIGTVAFAATPPPAVGRELGESSVSSGRSSLGLVSSAVGLSAPSPVSTSGLATSLGLGQVARGGLGRVAPVNLLTPRSNPLTGANGVGREVLGAGFPASSLAGIRRFGR